MGVSLTMSPIFLPQATLLQHPTALGPRRCSPQFAPDQRILRLVLQRLTPQRQSLHVFPESLKGLGLAIVGLRLGAPRELSHKFPQIMSTVTTIEIYRNVFLEPCCFLGLFWDWMLSLGENVENPIKIPNDTAGSCRLNSFQVAQLVSKLKACSEFSRAA